MSFIRRLWRERQVVERERLNLAGIIVIRDHVDQALPIAGDKNQEIVLLHGIPVFKRQKLLEHVETTNELQETPIFDARLYTSMSYQGENEGSNPLYVQLQASIDGKTWHALTIDSAIPTSTWYSQTNVVEAFYKILYKNTNINEPTTISITMMANR